MCLQPISGSQVSVVQGLPSSQLGGTPGEQMPAWQISLPLQTVASAHVVPLSTAVCVQPEVALQPSVVQGLPSSQLSAVPLMQRPV